MLRKNLILVGAGLAGCLLAIYLARRGFTVKLFEKRPDMRTHNISAGRSINLSLSERGIHALKEVGVFRKIEKHLIAMPGRMLHDEVGKLRYQSYGRNEWDVHYSVSRGALNKLLLDTAEATGRVSIFFNECCTEVNFETNRIGFCNEITGVAHSVEFDVVIGTDGAGSPVRRAMRDKHAIQWSDDPLSHGYKELNIPADRGGAHRLEKKALHIWPRGGYMLIALPNTDGSFTATLFLAHRGADSFESLADEQSVLDFFQNQFPDAVPLVANLTSDFLKNPIGSLGTIRCCSWHLGGKALLIGDAAHAIVPFHGQGMNCGFEDCSAFNQYLETFQDWGSLFAELTAVRKPNADAIADMALENYIEMRDSVRDPKFHLQKKIEWLLEERHPQRFIPRYSMVMFHRIPYAAVQRRGEIQSAILTRLSAPIDQVENVDIDLADKLVTGQLEPIVSTEWSKPHS